MDSFSLRWSLSPFPSLLFKSTLLVLPHHPSHLLYIRLVPVSACTELRCFSVQMLVMFSADLLAKSHTGRTALLWAAARGRATVVEQLIGFGLSSLCHRLFVRTSLSVISLSSCACDNTVCEWQVDISELLRRVLVLGLGLFGLRSVLQPEPGLGLDRGMLGLVLVFATLFQGLVGVSLVSGLVRVGVG